MKFIWVTFFSFLLVSAFGQSKSVKKSERLYHKGKYEKCIEKVNEYLIDEQKSPELRQFLVLSNLALYKNAEAEKSNLYLKKAVRNWEILQYYNQEQIDFSYLQDSLTRNIQNELLQIGNRESGQYIYFENKLAEVFQDTSEYYFALEKLPVFSEQVRSIPIDNSQYYTLQKATDKRKKVLELAKKLEGVRYRYGGTDPSGFDCSGFTQYLYKSVGIELPHNAHRQSKIGDVIDLAEAKPGDLVFFRAQPGKSTRVSHTGIIYSNDNGNIELIHCSSYDGVIHPKSEDRNSKYWLQRVYCVKQIIPEEE